MADGPVPEPRMKRDDSTVTRQQLSNVTSHRRTLQLAVALTVLHVYSNNIRTTLNTSQDLLNKFGNRAPDLLCGVDR